MMVLGDNTHILTVSKGAASMVSSTLSARATECEARRETTSKGVKPPASSNRAKILVTSSAGSGIRPSTAGIVWLGRPAKNSRRGAPCSKAAFRTYSVFASPELTGQLLRATAPANWTRSPADTGCLARNGMRLLTESSIPLLAAKSGSTVGKRSIEPSAPPPL